MWILLGTVFIASLLGSLHCVGMCGPFALLAGGASDRRSPTWVPTAAYSFGRLVTYCIVGLIFGSLGLALNRGTSFAPWQQSATFAAGGLMIMVGMIAIARQMGWKIELPSFAGPLQTTLQSLFQLVTRQPPLRKAFLIGSITCLMPCGWLYSFAIVAAGTGNPLWGAIVMAVFWSGTVPIMVALMLGFSKIGGSIQRRIPVAMASLVIAVGIFTIAFRAPVAIGNETNVVDRSEDLIRQVHAVDQAELPCCREK